jgi:hypothetical protein
VIGRVAIASTFLWAVVAACSTDVDLGGTSDGAVIDAGPPGPECAPCSTGSQCASGTCAQFAGDLYCATSCSTSGGCASGQTCTSAKASSGSTVNVCVPSSGACTPATPPADADGGPLDHCGSLNGPSIASSCEACGKYSNDCQANGCYGGYWCDESIRDCQPPPTSCP